MQADKPFDRSFKLLGDEDARGLLELIGCLAPGEEAEIEPLPRELVLPALEVDNGFRVRTAGRERIVQAELQARYRSEVGTRMADYGAALGLKFRLPVEQTLTLLSRRHAPRHVPETGISVYGGIRIEAHYRVVRLWELDPAWVLRRRRLHLLPWVSVMNSTDSQVIEAGDLLTERGNRRLAATFKLLGRVRYDEAEWEAILGRLKSMTLLEDIIEVSGLDKEWERKGEKIGRAEGRLTGMRDSLRLVIATRFPGLERHPTIETLQEVDRLEGLLTAITTAQNRESAQAALDAAAR